MAAKAKKSAAKKTSTRSKTTKAKTGTNKTASKNKSTVNGFQSIQDTTKAMETMMKNPQFDKFAQEAASAGQDQLEATMKSLSIFAKGMEDISKTCMALVQEVGEKNTSAAKAMMTCKTLNEYTQAQSKFAQDSFDDFMSSATKLSEMSVKVCTESFEPLNSQLNKAIQKASESIAA